MLAFHLIIERAKIVEIYIFFNFATTLNCEISFFAVAGFLKKLLKETSGSCSLLIGGFKFSYVESFCKSKKIVIKSLSRFLKYGWVLKIQNFRLAGSHASLKVKEGAEKSKTSIKTLESREMWLKSPFSDWQSTLNIERRSKNQNPFNNHKNHFDKLKIMIFIRSNM